MAFISKGSGVRSLNRVVKERRAYQRECKRGLAGDRHEGPHQLGNPLLPAHGGHSGEGKNGDVKPPTH